MISPVFISYRYIFNMYTLNILYSKSLEKYYAGYTNDLNRRFSEHNRIKGKFTDRGIPWEVVHTEKFQ